MTTLLAWLSAALALYHLLRALALDDRLWGKRRGGASRWNIWIPPRRWGDVRPAESGAPARRARRPMAFAILFGLLALVLSNL